MMTTPWRNTTSSSMLKKTKPNRIGTPTSPRVNATLWLSRQARMGARVVMMRGIRHKVKQPLLYWPSHQETHRWQRRHQRHALCLHLQPGNVVASPKRSAVPIINRGSTVPHESSHKRHRTALPSHSRAPSLSQ